MESRLLIVSICAVVMIAIIVYRSERPKGKRGLGLFAFKETLEEARPRSDAGKRNA
jgi:hypothetical protein